ncbi:hypothetical protein D3C80_1244480 [compost metagenome]
MLLYGFLETLFLLSAGFVWFFLLVAVMGLRLQANASLVENEAEPESARTGADTDRATIPHLRLAVARRNFATAQLARNSESGQKRAE